MDNQRPPTFSAERDSANSLINPANGVERVVEPAARQSLGSILRQYPLQILTLGALLILTVTGTIYAIISQNEPDSNTVLKAQPSSKFSVQEVSLGGIIRPDTFDLHTIQSLSINGQLRANNSLVLAPTAQPTTGSATIGQVYFDRTGSALAYYNGTQFISVAGTNDLDALRAEVTAVSTRVSAIPPVPTTPAAVSIPSDIATLGAGNNFTSANTFTAGLNANSLTAGTLTTTGNTSLQGSLAVTGITTLGPATASSLVLSSPLDVASGGTGASSFTVNGVLIGQGSGPVATLVAGAGNLCLMSNAGNTALGFDTCPDGSGSGVSSLNGIDGTLTLANATAAGATVTIDNATTITKGIASFNAANFSVTSGAVNTIQNISTTASPSFASITASNLSSTLNQNLTLNAAGTGNLYLTGYDCSASGGGGKLTVDATGQVICGADGDTDTTGITTITAGNGITITGGNNTIAASVRTGFGIQVDSNGIGLIDTCLTNEILKRTAGGWACSSDTVGTGDGVGATTVGTLDGGTANANGATITGTSLFLQSASNTNPGLVNTGTQTFAGAKTFNGAVTLAGGATVTGNFTASGTVNGATISGGTLSAGSFTGGSVSGGAVTGGTLSATAVNGLNVSGTALTGSGTLTVASATNQNLTLNAAGTGNLYLTGYDCSASGGGGKLTVDATGQVVCGADGGGSGVSISGTATDGALTKFNATGQIMNSNLYEASTTLTYNGNALINAPTSFTGNLLDLKLNNVSKFSVTEAGNTTVAGALAVTGLTTLTGALNANGGITTNNQNITAGTGTVTSAIINATTSLQLNGANINTAGTLSNVAYQNQANIFTQDNSFRTATNSSSALTVQNASSVNVFSVDTVNKSIAVGAPITYNLTTYTYSQSFGTGTNYTTGTSAVNASIDDLDGDGDKDIVSMNNGNPGTVSVLLNNGNGTFATKVDYSVNTFGWGVATADMDADGDIDVVASSGSAISILKNNGNGTLAAKVDYATDSTSQVVVLGDIDGDTDKDVVVSVSSNEVSVFKNNGNGTLAAKVDYALDNVSYAVELGDFDGDSDLDMAATASIANEMSVFLNNGTGTFGAKVDYPTGTSARGIKTADLNGDGKKDLVVTNRTGSSVSVFIGNGNGTFAAKVDYTTISDTMMVSLRDFDSDADIDIVAVGGSANAFSYLANNGNGTFAAKVDYTVPGSSYSINSADLDGDGDSDVVTTGNTLSVVTVRLNGIVANPSSVAVPSTGSFTAASSSMSALTLQGALGQTVDLLRIQNNSATPLFVVAKNGNIGIGDVMNLADSVHKLNSTGSIGVNTASGFTGNLLELKINDTSKLAVASSGSLTIAAGATFAVGNSTGTNASCTAGQTLNGITVVGGIVTAGTCTANGADLAESYKSVDSLLAGEIVSVDGSNYPGVKRSSGIYDKKLIGIVSTQPKEVLGDDDSSNDYPIALTGRVPAKVNLEGGVIRAGDKITSSSVPGVGMKAIGSGMTVGTALQDYDGTGSAVIQVFVEVGYYEPPQTEILQANTAEFADLNVSGTASIDKLVVNTVIVQGSLTVNGTLITQSILVNGHIVSGGSTPSVTAESATCSALATTVDGTDTAGTITVTTSSSCSANDKLMTLTFASPFSKAPRITLTAANAKAAAVQTYVDSDTVSGSNFAIGANTTLSSNTTYKWYYQVIE